MSLFCPQSLVWKIGTLLVLLLFMSFPASAQNEPSNSPIMVPNPATDLWRAVRQREGPAAGETRVKGVEAGVLIDRSGDDFRNYRRQDFVSGATIVLGVFAATILLFYLVRGRIGVPGGHSGRRIMRFTDFERTIHWLAAILLIFLALTGLTLLFGRFVLLPVFGPEVFGVVASLSKDGHNLFGPLFLVSLVLLFICFATRNIPARGDLTWLAKGGGMIGKSHVSAGFFNAMEKIWFWAVILLGAVVSISGLILLFPILGLGREDMQLALIIHGVAAVLLIAGSFGHIYIGTIGTVGSLESMTTGYVDENWAKVHHDRWLAEVQDQVEPVPNTEEKSPKGDLQTSTDQA